MSDPRQFLLERGMELELAGREAEAIDVYTELLTIDPDAAQAWFNLGMLHRRRNDTLAASAAFESCLRHPERLPTALRRLAEQELGDVGREVAQAPGPADSGDTVFVQVRRGETTSLVGLTNDSGVEIEQLQESLEKLKWARTWLDAFLVFRESPELGSHIAQTLLRLDGANESDTFDAQVAAENLRVLQRGREIGIAAAYAEQDGFTAEEFVRLAEAIGLQGVLAQLIEAPDEAARDAILAAHPGFADSDDTYLVVAYLWRMNEGEGRARLERLRWYLESRRR